MSGGTVVTPGAAAALAALDNKQGNGNVQPLVPVLPNQPTRPVYVHKVPPALKDVADGITHIGVVKLSVAEEFGAIDRGNNNQTRAVAELAIESLRCVVTERGTQRLMTFDGSANSAYERMDPKLRVFVTSVFNKHHSLTKEETGNFLDEYEVQV